jgi:hypothetical protein
MAKRINRIVQFRRRNRRDVVSVSQFRFRGAQRLYERWKIKWTGRATERGDARMAASPTPRCFPGAHLRDGRNAFGRSGELGEPSPAVQHELPVEVVLKAQ